MVCGTKGHGFDSHCPPLLTFLFNEKLFVTLIPLNSALLFDIFCLKLPIVTLACIGQIFSSLVEAIATNPDTVYK